MGVIHTAGTPVIVRLDRFQPPRQKPLLSAKQLRKNHHGEQVLTSLLDSSEGLDIHCTVEVFDHPSLSPFLRSYLGGPVRQPFSLQSSAHAIFRKGDCLPRRSRLTESHEYSATPCITLDVRGAISSEIPVSWQTISSVTLSANGVMRCNRSKRLSGIWSRLSCSFKS